MMVSHNRTLSIHKKEVLIIHLPYTTDIKKVDVSTKNTNVSDFIYIKYPKKKQIHGGKKCSDCQG